MLDYHIFLLFSAWIAAPTSDVHVPVSYNRWQGVQVRIRDLSLDCADSWMNGYYKNNNTLRLLPQYKPKIIFCNNVFPTMILMHMNATLFLILQNCHMALCCGSVHAWGTPAIKTRGGTSSSPIIPPEQPRALSLRFSKKFSLIGNNGDGKWCRDSWIGITRVNFYRYDPRSKVNTASMHVKFVWWLSPSWSNKNIRLIFMLQLFLS